MYACKFIQSESVSGDRWMRLSGLLFGPAYQRITRDVICMYMRLVRNVAISEKKHERIENLTQWLK